MMVIDFETYSELDLRTAGAYRYAEHPSTRVLCMAYHDGMIAEVWWPGEPFPEAVRLAAVRAVVDGELLVAHNAVFERAIWNGPLRRLVPDLPILSAEHWHCTMASAARHGWPLGLEDLCEALDLNLKKDTTAGQVLRVLTKPSKTRAHPDHFATLEAYAKRDVEVEHLLTGILPPLTGGERRVWLLDQTINDRGIRLDRRAAVAIREAVEAERHDANRRLAELTGVDRATMAERLRAWCRERGVSLPDFRAATVEAALRREDLPPDVREVLAIRADAGGAAVKKLDAMLTCVCADGRMRGLLQYHGAIATGRWAGRLVQPQNLPRPSQDVDPEDFLRLSRPALREKYGSVLQAASDALRKLIIADPGKLLVRADLSAIEARLVFWLAGHDDAMEIYRTGGDIYCEMARAVFKRPITKADKYERFIGKTIILGCGYQMGAAKFRATANAAGANLTEEQAAEYVRAYRTRWNRVPAMWYGMQEAVETATRNPGQKTEWGPVAFKSTGRTLLVRLPSGRILHWQGLRLDYEGDFGEERLKVVVKKMATGQWTDMTLFGGMIVERVVQATARDILVHAMFQAEEHGLPVVLSVHDEIVTEPDENGPGVNTLITCMTTAPVWAPGLVLGAEGEADRRYGK